MLTILDYWKKAFEIFNTWKLSRSVLWLEISSRWINAVGAFVYTLLSYVINCPNISNYQINTADRIYLLIRLYHFQDFTRKSRKWQYPMLLLINTSPLFNPLSLPLKPQVPVKISGTMSIMVGGIKLNIYATLIWIRELAPGKPFKYLSSVWWVSFVGLWSVPTPIE